MKKYTLLIVFLAISKSVFSQFEAQFSQYMFNPAQFNPAAVGVGDLIDVRGQHRMNWIGFPTGGMSTSFEVSSPVKLFGTKHGVGLSFLNDQFGGIKNQTFHFNYAYITKLGKGKLNVGTGLGFVSVGFSGDSISKYPINIGDYHDLLSDPALPTTAVNGMQFDMGLGAWYRAEKWYAGVSYRHLNNPTVDWDGKYKFTQTGGMYVTGGYDFDIPDKKVVLTPSALWKTDFAGWAIDLSARAEYDGKFWGGLSYRVVDAIVIFGGLNIMNGLSVGYSVDISTNKLITANYGSHELMLMYSFAYVFEKKKNKYKSIRFL